MRSRLSLPALLLFALPALARADPDVAALRDAALGDTVAWSIVEGLTTEIGPRLAGTPAEARARDWAVARLKALGFADPRIEDFPLKVWQRGAEEAAITAPFPQPLTLAALGNSPATPARGIEAPVIAFDSLAALEAADPAAVKGRIVFLDHAMRRTQDGSSYAAWGPVRRKGPSVASAKGAAAILIRSLGTGTHRSPHVGTQSWGDGVKPIPAAALSLPDADQLKRVLARGAPVTVRLRLTPTLRDGRSGNVLAEVPGRDPAKGIVLVACHLDSWDLGTGAIDDAAGCGIVTAAAKCILDRPQPPLRTIRIVWYGAEEVGIVGGEAYRDRHRGERHAFAAESDFGADRIWKIDSKVAPAALPAIDRLAATLAPLGIQRGNNEARGGSDIAPLADAGVPVIALRQDGTRYFDLHHTSDDTLDKIDPAQLAQNVAAYTAMLATLADDPVDLGPVGAAPILSGP